MVTIYDEESLWCLMMATTTKFHTLPQKTSRTHLVQEMCLLGVRALLLLLPLLLLFCVDGLDDSLFFFWAAAAIGAAKDHPRMCEQEVQGFFGE